MLVPTLLAGPVSEAMTPIFMTPGDAVPGDAVPDGCCVAGCDWEHPAMMAAAMMRPR